MKLFANKPQRQLAAVLLFGLAPTLLWAASQTTYKWTDQNGRVTYGDHPPLGVKAEEIRISTGTSSAAAANTEESGVPTESAPQPAADSKAATSVASGPSPEEAKRLCEQARSNLEILQDHALIRQTDVDGNVLILDESQKQEQINTAKTIIGRYCK